jgi:hypothetical protein
MKNGHRLLGFLCVTSSAAVPGCKGDECTYSDVSCDGNVMVFCGTADQDPRFRIERRACDPGRLCTVGQPASDPSGQIPAQARYVYCLADLGADARCTNQIGFCSENNEPLVCQDGHALSPCGAIPCGPCSPSLCQLDPNQPGTWPTCRPSPPSLCTDRDSGPFCDASVTE